MRSSKNRSRNKSNRQRSIGNIINRVFDSSGPEGKVRGTPQQIIEKYQMLARDAQLSNDRVAAENFLQHAEHYTRMLSEAQSELAREQQDRQVQGGNGNGQHGNPQSGGGQQGGGSYGGGSYGGGQGGYAPQGGERQPQPQQQRDRYEARSEPRGRDDQDDPQPELPAFLTGISPEDDFGPVPTPEARQRNDNSERPQRREGERQDRSERRPRNDQPRNDPPRTDQPRTDQPRNDPQRNDPQRQPDRNAAQPVDTPAPAETRAPVQAAPTQTAPAVAAPVMAEADAPAAAPRAPRAPRKPRSPKPDAVVSGGDKGEVEPE